MSSKSVEALEALKGPTRMFKGFDEFEVEVERGVTIFGRRGGSGPPLLLLHGFPQNHLIWHRTAEQLAKTFTVVAIDLRGYGLSTKLELRKQSDASHSKRAMAQDSVRVMKHLGFDDFYLCGHDRGARVAHRICVDYPAKVTKVIVLDIAPTLVMYEKTDFTFAKAYYHWFFLIQPYPFPESLINSNPEAFMDYHMGGRQQGSKKIFDEDAYKAYMQMMRDPAGVNAMCEDYRASASIDLDHHRQDQEDGRRIQCPLMVLWGQHGIIEKCYDVKKEWQDVSESTVVGESLDCGHYIPEEQPDILLEKMNDFFK